MAEDKLVGPLEEPEEGVAAASHEVAPGGEGELDTSLLNLPMSSRSPAYLLTTP